ncbi:MAG: DNA-binding protein [Prochlorococcus sp. SP3034]|nr:DNA-binding protein [Prochlorococcus sp. SP3034]|tara:strand:- start:5 stop:331 length:327 start_codon:yes stop_codon:yes gene_type:complete
MFSKIFNKLKSILGKKTSTEKPKTKKVAKATKKAKTSKTTKTSKSKKQDAKKIVESFKSLPGIGAKSAKAFYDAGFKTTNQIISATDEELLSVQGVGINLVKKLRSQK